MFDSTRPSRLNLVCVDSHLPYALLLLPLISIEMIAKTDIKITSLLKLTEK